MQRMVKVPSQALWRINYQELKLLYRVGIGAFGEVFKASFRGTIVAVKRILAKGMKDTEREVLFNRELEFMKYVSGSACLCLILSLQVASTPKYCPFCWGLPSERQPLHSCKLRVSFVSTVD